MSPTRAPPPTHIPTLIIGAGIQGLAYAHTHHRISPHEPLLILDANASVGGVWAKENIYPGMKSNNLWGNYEFIDFPMGEAGSGMGGDEGNVGKEEFKQRKGKQFGLHIPGEAMHQYLDECVDKMGLRNFLRLQTKVLGAEEVDLEGGTKGWVVRLVDVEDGDIEQDIGPGGKVKPAAGAREYEIRCKNLIIATGLCSVPNPMHINGQESFQKSIINFSELGKKALAMLKDENIKHVTVSGGTKAAYDAVYMFASQGKKVTWIIRRTGHGPCWMSPPYVYIGPVRCWLEMLVTSRWMTWLSPCIWGEREGAAGWVRRALHDTRVGRWVVDGFWSNLSMGTLQQAGYLDDDGEGKLKALWPVGNAWGYATQLGILNYRDDVFEYVRKGQVEVVRKDVLGMGEGGKVLCEGGKVVETDAWVASTGWRFDPAVKLGPEENLIVWGVPGRGYTEGQRELVRMLNKEADRQIWRRFPRLKPESRRRDGFLEEREKLWGTGKEEGEGSGDVFPTRAEEVQKREQEYAPWRLWRGIAPPAQVVSGERNLVFLGMIMTIPTVLKAEISALWAFAYLNQLLEPRVRALSTSYGKGVMLEVPEVGKGLWGVPGMTLKAVMLDATLFTRFGKWRHPFSRADNLPDFTFDALPYFDLLLGDLGLRQRRKGWGFLGEAFGGGYAQKDYRGLVDEWVKMKGGNLKQA
ncbi:hypothetical protein MMC30_003948 [Trapelia coarctata]|nr:hypothetical protein [Trapelia coarctata]